MNAVVVPMRPARAEPGEVSLTTLAPHIARYITSRRKMGTYTAESVRTVRPRLDTLDRSHGNRPLAHLTRRAIERWLESLEHLATNSRCAYLASVRQFTRWLAVEQLVRIDPCQDIPPLRRARAVPRAQTTDAIAAVLGACETDRDRAVVWLMVGLGLRRAEVAGLRWEHYDPRERLLLVVDGKGGHERLLPVPSGVASALGRIERTTGPIVASERDGSHLRPATIGARVAEIMSRAGVKRAAWDGVSAHALRHTAASDVLDVAGDLRIVQQMLGHQSLSSTAIYLRRASAGQIRSAMEGRTYNAA